MSKKIIFILIFSSILCMIFVNTTYAKSLDDMISSADGFLGTSGTILPINQEALRATSDYIYNTLLVIAVAIAVIVGSILGIKFMIESAEDKAKIKEAMIPFVVGCFVVFGAFGIWKVAVEVGNAVSGTASSSTVGETQVRGEKATLLEEYRKNNNVTQTLDYCRQVANTDVSSIPESEKEEYKKVVNACLSYISQVRSQSFDEERTELQTKLNNILTKLNN